MIKEKESEPSPNPKINDALNEIREILKKYDLAGIASVTDPTGLYGEIREIEPSWSCARVIHSDTGSAVAWTPSQGNDEASRIKRGKSTLTMFGTFMRLAEFDHHAFSMVIQNLKKGGIPDQEVPVAFRQTPIV